MTAPKRLLLTALAATIAWCAAPRHAAAAVAPGDTSQSRIASSRDKAARVTIPVMINGTGPYDFVVDTAADRTVISSELAAALKLPDGTQAVLHDIVGVQSVRTAVISSLSFGGHEAGGLEAPVLAASGMGALGMIGIDSLRGRRIELDLPGGALWSRPGLNPEFDDELIPPQTIIVRGHRRFGQLILVDAKSHGEPIFVILDSGAQNTIGNLALRQLIAAPRPGGKPAISTELISVTGRQTTAQLAKITAIQLGDMTIAHVPIAFADLHIFSHLGLADRPAMLLGMDVLRQFRSISIDFPHYQAIFTPR